MQLQQALGDLWVECFVEDWLYDHNIHGSHRLEENLSLRRRILQQSFDMPNERKADGQFICYQVMVRELLRADDRGRSIAAEHVQPRTRRQE